MFTDTAAWPEGLRPKPASKARRAGAPLGVGLPPVDVVGAIVPDSVHPDIGAFVIKADDAAAWRRTTTAAASAGALANVKRAEFPVDGAAVLNLNAGSDGVFFSSAAAWAATDDEVPAEFGTGRGPSSAEMVVNSVRGFRHEIDQGSGASLPWTPIPARTSPYSMALSESELVHWANGPHSYFAPVGTRAGGNISAQLDSDGIAKAFRFQLDNTRAGIKQRAELSNCFVTNRTLLAAGVDPAGAEAHDESELHTLYWHCAGVPADAVTEDGWSRDVDMSVSYDLLIPEGGLSSKFHGREDPRVFLAPNGSIGTGVHRK
jgi:hypothetical protein